MFLWTCVSVCACVCLVVDLAACSQCVLAPRHRHTGSQTLIKLCEGSPVLPCVFIARMVRTACSVTLVELVFDGLQPSLCCSSFSCRQRLQNTHFNFHTFVQLHFDENKKEIKVACGRFVVGIFLTCRPQPLLLFVSPLNIPKVFQVK